MTDSPADANPGTDAISSSRCPWCSAQVSATTATCPSCGAKLRDDADAEIPGVTQIDPAATAARPTPRGRGLIGWLSGDYETSETDADRAGVEPPTDAVKQEMLRLEMEALRTELEAEAIERAAEQGDAALAEAAAAIPDPANDTSDTTPDATATAAAPPAAAAQPADESDPGVRGAGS